MNRAAAAVAVVLLTLASGALAWGVRVDDADGPVGLAERVARAEQRWLDAGADLTSVDRSVLVRYASRASMGPDALTLVVTGGPPGVDLEVWVRSDADPDAPLDDALVVAIGIALGGTPGVGVLDPRLGPDPRIPSADDVAALAPGGGAPGDVTGDGAVGFADLLAMAEAWGRRGVNLPADLDGDGTVDDADLEILREHYEFGPLPSERSTTEPATPSEVPASDGTEGPSDAADGGDDTAADDESLDDDEEPGGGDDVSGDEGSDEDGE